MQTLKKFLKIIGIVFLIAIPFGVWYAWRAFPIISGYGAKNMCSAFFVQHRNPKDVEKEDLGDFPLSLGKYVVDEKDSSVTGTVWGFAKRKAVFRKGIGCTLVNDFTEAEIKAQRFNIPSAPSQSRDTIRWPYGDKVLDSISPNVDINALNKAVNDVMNESKNGVPAYTRAVVILYDGEIVAEKYAAGFDKNTVMLGWSMSKSLTGTLIGILIKQGRLDINAPAPVEQWKNDNRHEITLKNLLQQTSGLDFDEDYKSPSDVTRMLFNKGDMAAYTIARPLKYKPGTVFNYSSGNSNVLSRIVRNTVGEDAYTGFPYIALFHKINAYSFLLEPDASGTYIGSSYSYATPRDFARFGLLYYNNGVWNGEQLLPLDWVAEARKPAPCDSLQRYGYQFWLNGFKEENPSERKYPDAPSDLFHCSGYGGQFVFIIPSKKLVIVRMGLHDIDRNNFLKKIIASVK